MKRKKRPFLLLEVMIAFAIVVLCMPPLIAPNVWMIKEGRSSLRDLERERYVNLIYVSIIEKMYANEISWSTLESKTPWIPHDLPAPIPHGWNYIVQVFFKMIGKKENHPEGVDSHLVEVKLSLQKPNDKQNPLTYTYSLYLQKEKNISVKQETQTPEETEEDEVE